MYARQHPERVRSLTLLSVGAYPTLESNHLILAIVTLSFTHFGTVRVFEHGAIGLRDYKAHSSTKPTRVSLREGDRRH
jgi:pimeloyl-ACP methyl ester carboxylesterase